MERLFNAMRKDNDWSSIAACVGTRDKVQCQTKWKQLMSPKKESQCVMTGRVRSSYWSLEEHRRVMNLYDRIRDDWIAISDVGEGEGREA